MPVRSSCQPFRRLAWIGAAGGLLLLSGGWNGPVGPGGSRDPTAFWLTGVPRPIGVRDGRTTFRVPTAGPSSQTLVVVSALSRQRGPFPIRLTARAVKAAANPPMADDGPQMPPKRTPPSASTRPSAPSAGRLPPRDRVFHLMVREGDPSSPSNYVAVRGVLKGVGHWVQVYVASEDVDQVGRGVLEDVITTFDHRIHPVACERYGTPRDVDGDGRFTILFSSWLDHLGGGRHAVDGFVRVADLDSSVPAPFGNLGDMMYLNAGLQPGPYLRTIIAHEYMHAVVYTRKTLDHGDEVDPGPEEEGWLDEALAHVAEDIHGFATSNIDYRISAFLSRPEHYQLMVDDYFAADLFRSHGNRGSTYLFLRWCADRFGPALIGELVRSSRQGMANVEAATGTTFAALYRRWSVALFTSGLDPSAPGSGESADGFRSTNLRSPWSDWEMAGPRYSQVVPGGPVDCWEAVGTSSHYAVLDGSSTGAVEIEVAGPAEAEIQVTALPLGNDQARMSLSLESSRGPSGELCIRARIAERNGLPVQLSALAWEPMVPGPRPHIDGHHSGRLDMLGLTVSFGTSAVPAGSDLRSGTIRLSGISRDTGPIVLKVVGTDPHGRRISAWADVNASSERPSDDP